VLIGHRSTLEIVSHAAAQRYLSLTHRGFVFVFVNRLGPALTVKSKTRDKIKSRFFAQNPNSLRPYERSQTTDTSI